MLEFFAGFLCYAAVANTFTLTLDLGSSSVTLASAAVAISQNWNVVVSGLIGVETAGSSGDVNCLFQVAELNGSTPSNTFVSVIFNPINLTGALTFKLTGSAATTHSTDVMTMQMLSLNMLN